jgi:arylformamidase
MQRRRIWDISQKLRPGLPVWPGDTPFAQERVRRMDETTPVNVGRVTMSAHSGAHADAPLHYAADAAGAGALALERYLGPARLVDARGCGACVAPRHVERSLAGAPPRILIRTYESFPHDAWRSDFAAIAPETIELLADAGVFLIGVDSPSLDPEQSKTMEAHKAMHRRQMSVLEGLVLDEPPPGDYELIALPLPLAEMDAAPVRAILRELA